MRVGYLWTPYFLLPPPQYYPRPPSHSQHHETPFPSSRSPQYPPPHSCFSQPPRLPFLSLPSPSPSHHLGCAHYHISASRIPVKGMIHLDSVHCRTGSAKHSVTRS